MPRQKQNAVLLLYSGTQSEKLGIGSKVLFAITYSGNKKCFLCFLLKF